MPNILQPLQLRLKGLAKVDFEPKPVSERPSRTWWVKNAKPWLQSQVDVYEALLQKQAESVKDCSDLWMVADVSQSANRGAYQHLWALGHCDDQYQHGMLWPYGWKADAP